MKWISQLLLVGILLLIPTSAQAFHVRLLILKHSPGEMADSDADLAIHAVRSAFQRGLHIATIGNKNIDRSYRWGQIGTALTIHLTMVEFGEFDAGLGASVAEGMHTNATPGDTLIVFTIGHGFQGGGLQQIGQREKIMKILGKAAGDAKQRILWWQLSCHAASGLPSVQSLPSEQQDYISMIASSSAEEESAAGVQGAIMEKVFIALATDDPELDRGRRGVVTAQELRDFLRSDNLSRGDLVFAKNLEEPIFVKLGQFLAQSIPVRDRNNPQRKYPKEYILIPKWQGGEISWTWRK